MATVTTREKACPECHETCDWCSWYLKNARETGCGSSDRRKCEWGTAAKGKACGTCDGSGRVLVTTYYAHLPKGGK